MNVYYRLTDFAQYGANNYGEGNYGENVTETGSTDNGGGSLVDTGVGVLPGLIVGALLIAASLFLLLKRSKKK